MLGARCPSPSAFVIGQAQYVPWPTMVAPGSPSAFTAHMRCCHGGAPMASGRDESARVDGGGVVLERGHARHGVHGAGIERPRDDHEKRMERAGRCRRRPPVDRSARPEYQLVVGSLSARPEDRGKVARNFGCHQVCDVRVPRRAVGAVALWLPSARHGVVLSGWLLRHLRRTK